MARKVQTGRLDGLRSVHLANSRFGMVKLFLFVFRVGHLAQKTLKKQNGLVKRKNGETQKLWLFKGDQNLRPFWGGFALMLVIFV